ncbi:MAG: hypothetical protein FJX57_09315, partial [Alphaproteobacteria bacterium]|nr:hypothetical protein [Alphaproteobacteria bacterium]
MWKCLVSQRDCAVLGAAFTVLAGLLLAPVDVGAQPRAASWDLTIVHANDVHSRLQEINRFDSGCTDKERQDKQCWGGMARLGYKAQEIVAEVKSRKGNVVLLDAGDQFQGSLFYSTYKG